MRTRRLIPIVLIAITSFSQVAHAAMRPDTDWAQGPGLMDRLEFWLLNTIERVEVLFDVKVQSVPAPAGGQGSGAPAVQSDCRSAIDPNGGACAP
jgi:hypothetical protein